MNIILMLIYKMYSRRAITARMNLYKNNIIGRKRSRRQQISEKAERKPVQPQPPTQSGESDEVKNQLDKILQQISNLQKQISGLQKRPPKEPDTEDDWSTDTEEAIGDAEYERSQEKAIEKKPLKPSP